ncbi:MAG: type II toxin-antitoxin system Phd/YefM family antitoxin [Caldilineaceae bacterium]|nr:type II toxin-antitoxin system Phd/YefM family antitoxin [Caldilineaceae bacterium]
MSTIMAQPKVMTAEEVRRGLGDVFDVVVAGQDVVIERRSKPVVAMIRYEDYAAIQEELEDLRDAQRAREVLEAIRSGKMKTVPWEQLKAELKAEGLIDD